MNRAPHASRKPIVLRAALSSCRPPGDRSFRGRSPVGRREFLRLAAAGTIASVSLSALPALLAASSPYRAVVFDAFPIFDPRPVFALAEALFPGRGAELSAVWRTRQFEYQWLRALAGRYVDFERTTDDALAFATTSLRLILTEDRRAQLIGAYRELTAWPDVPTVLGDFRGAGLKLALLSNMTPAMLAGGIRRSGLDGMFDHVLSTDRIRSYKPDPRAYQLGVDALGLPRDQILFAAFAGWDAAGARWFGYPTVWINRLAAPREELGVVPDATHRDLGGLADFARSRR